MYALTTKRSRVARASLISFGRSLLLLNPHTESVKRKKLIALCMWIESHCRQYNLCFKAEVNLTFLSFKVFLYWQYKKKSSISFSNSGDGWRLSRLSLGKGSSRTGCQSTKGVKFRESFMLTSTSTPTASFKGFAYLSENRKLIWNWSRSGSRGGKTQWRIDGNKQQQMEFSTEFISIYWHVG